MNDDVWDEARNEPKWIDGVGRFADNDPINTEDPIAWLDARTCEGIWRATLAAESRQISRDHWQGRSET